MNREILDTLIKSPAFPELLQEAQLAWSREQELRQRFYQEITPEHKWEFIQGEVIMHSPSLERHTMTVLRLYDLLRPYTRLRACGRVLVESP